MTVEELKVIISAEIGELKQAVKEAKSEVSSLDSSVKVQTKSINKSFTRTAKSITRSFTSMAKTIIKVVSITALGKLGAQAIEVASNLEEVQNVVDISFGKMANDVNWFAKNAMTSFGLSELAVKKTASTFMAMSNGMGIAQQAGKLMSTQLTALTGDMASFYNTTEEMASTALASVFTGETETLKKFGIVLTEANLNAYALSKGIKTSYQNMSQAQKVALRYNYVMQATANAQGDFARTSISWANQIRVLKLRWQEFMGVVGTILKNVFVPMVGTLNTILQQLILIANAIAETFGGNKLQLSNGMDDFAGSVDDATQNLEDATDQANKLKKTIFGFDELNILKDDSDSKNNNLGGIDFPLNAPYDLESLKQDSQIIKSFEDITTAINKFFDNLNEKFKKAREILGNLGTKLADYINRLFDGIDWSKLGQTIGNGLNAIINFFKNFYQTLKGYDIGKSIAFMLNGILYTVDWAGLKDAIVGKINFVIDAFNGFVTFFDWQKLARVISYEVYNIANEIKWSDLGQALARGLNGAIEIVYQLVDTKAIKRAVDGIIEAIKQFLSNVDWKKLGQTIHDGIIQIFESLKDSNVTSAIGKAIRDFLDGLKPIELMVEYLKTKGHLIADAIAGFFGKDHAGPILVSISTLFTFIGATIGKAFAGIINVIKNNFDKIAILGLLFKDKIGKIIEKGLLSNIGRQLGKTFKLSAKEIEASFKVIPETMKVGLKGIKAQVEMLGKPYNLEMSWISVLKNGIASALDSLKLLFVTAEGGLTAFGWISGVVGAVGGLVTAFFGLRDSIKEGVDAASTLKTVLGGTAAGAGIGLMVGGPAGAAVGAGIGFVASSLATDTVAIVQNFDTIKEAASNTWNTIKEKSSDTWSNVKESASEMWDSISNSTVVQSISSTWEQIKQSASTTWESIKQNVSDAWEGIKEAFAPAGEWFKQLWGSFSTTAQEVFYNIGVFGKGCVEIVKAGFGELKEQFNSSVWEPIKEGASNLWNDITTSVTNTFAQLKEGISEIWNELVTFITTSWEELKTSFSESLTTITDFLTVNVIEPLKELFAPVYEWFKENVIDKVVEGIKIGFESAIELAGACWLGIQNVFSAVGEWFSAKFTEAVEAVKNSFSSLGDSISQLPDIIKQAFIDIANTIISCINNAISNAIDKINSLISMLQSIEVFGITPFSGMTQLTAPQIPKLANGGVLTSPTTVTVGEYAGASNNPEIVSPKSLMLETMREANLDLINAVFSMGNKISKAVEDKDLDVYMDTTKVTRKISREQEYQNKNKGSSLVLV